jgi:hypothetical protein
MLSVDVGPDEGGPWLFFRVMLPDNGEPPRGSFRVARNGRAYFVDWNRDGIEAWPAAGG